MGLDISVLKNVRRVECAIDREVEDCSHDRLRPAPYFEARADYLSEGCYEGEEGMGFRAGSYGHYNRWREVLSSKFLGEMPATVWDSPNEYADRPFVELVQFSDCEGFIGPETSAKLASDFAAHAARAEAELDTWDWIKYQQWQAAFEQAAHNGVVRFH